MNCEICRTPISYHYEYQIKCKSCEEAKKDIKKNRRNFILFVIAVVIFLSIFLYALFILEEEIENMKNGVDTLKEKLLVTIIPISFFSLSVMLIILIKMFLIKKKKSLKIIDERRQGWLVFNIQFTFIFAFVLEFNFHLQSNMSIFILTFHFHWEKLW